MKEFKQILREYGIGGAACEGMEQYAKLLLEENTVHNLTRITVPEEVAVKHFVDSAHPDICALIKDGARVIDVGTGGGFPGAPLKLMRPDIDLTFIESSEKKLNFVKGACEKIGIDAAFLNGRAEEIAANENREVFDVAVSRAVASLPMLLELLAGFVKKGGLLLAYKGAAAQQELMLSKNAMGQLKLQFIKKLDVPIEDGASHCVLVFEKTAVCPNKYPRRFAQIKKSPL